MFSDYTPNNKETPSLTNKVTAEVYTQNIPDCCKLSTFEEHRDIIWFCWGLIEHIKNNTDPREGCEHCTFYKTIEGDTK
jgi:hypothetical protein